jgi:hypothetical protein
MFGDFIALVIVVRQTVPEFFTCFFYKVENAHTKPPVRYEVRISIAGEGRDNQSSPAIEKTD